MVQVEVAAGAAPSQLDAPNPPPSLPPFLCSLRACYVSDMALNMGERERGKRDSRPKCLAMPPAQTLLWGQLHIPRKEQEGAQGNRTSMPLGWVAGSVGGKGAHLMITQSRKSVQSATAGDVGKVGKRLCGG